MGYYSSRCWTASGCRPSAPYLLRMQGDVERVRAELEQLRQRVLAGEPFDSLALRYSEEEDTRGVGGSLGLVALETLPGELRTLVESLPDGGVSAPVPYLADPTRPALQLVYRKRLIPEHPAQLPEDFAILQRMCRQWKREQLYRQWIGQLRQRFPWQLRP